jgi:ABC-type multidrug transport system ATPase subunit
MLRILFSNTGKRYNRNWIFRNMTLEIPAGSSIAVLGENGSGKSTLLQLAAGYLAPSEGTVEYYKGDTGCDADILYTQLSLAAPYLELIEEFTLHELASLHGSFKTFQNGMGADGVIQLTGLESAASKQIRYFSSGMKQRVRLALAILSDTPLLLLDEPLTNLDAGGIAWYKKMITDFTTGRTVMVCSNNFEEEYFFCRSSVNMRDYKTEPAASRLF